VTAWQFGLSCTRWTTLREAKMTAFMRGILPDAVFDNGIKKKLVLEEVRESLMSK
jgi:hypothetical protein